MTNQEEVVQLPRAYRWMSRYSPIFLSVVGLAMVLYAMLATKPDAVLITLIVMGVGSLIVGALLPRIKGPVEVGTAGVKTSVEGIQSIDAVRTIVAAAAETVAETTIPDQPDKAAQVKREVRMILDVVTLWLQSPSPQPISLLSKLRHPSRSSALRNTDPELLATYSRFIEALTEFAEREE